MSNISGLTEKANTGDIKAIRELSTAYLEGNGVEQDFTEAFEWMEKAAELGDAESQSDLADVLHNMEKHEESFQWMQKAAEQGFPRAQYNLGCLYRDGIGTSKNREQSLLWFQKATENGLSTKRSLFGMIMDSFVEVVRKENELLANTPSAMKNMFYDERRNGKGIFGALFSTLFGIILALLLFRLPWFCIKLLFCPLIGTYRYLTEK